AAMDACERALAQGVFCQAIRPPTVPDGSSRLRIAVMASHTRSELRWAAGVIARAVREAAPERKPGRAPQQATAAPVGRGDSKVFDGFAEAA
ncbi:MAG: 8-amino-7-oxononanoate synthase, partial [Thermoleophilaceae bacterium]|nr:8-amino-7-oxononanoate synthase [Thermoleophilaceae bacterium]